MLRKLLVLAVCLAGAWLSSPSLAAVATNDAGALPRLIRVTLDRHAPAPLSGRLLIFATPKAAAHARDGKVTEVDADALTLGSVWVAAQEVHHLAPGSSVTVDADLIAFPSPLSQLKPGDYLLQAVLDVNHNYNYHGRSAGDWVGPVAQVHIDGSGMLAQGLSLDRALPSHPLWWLPENAKPERRAAQAEARKHVTEIGFTSPALTAFWGRPIQMKALVLTPPGYAGHPRRRYPTVYFTHGYTGSLTSLTKVAAQVDTFMRDGQMPPMIWVFLDQSGPTGTNEFADSVNNGPWGRALTTELIPHLERQFRMDGRASGRFLNGHSSGGWATLWLQTRYPKVFGGTWSTSPDPSDFHDFTGPNLYAPHANVYHRPDGTPWPLVRDKGKVIASFEQFSKLERVFGPYGGQMASFEWVFSPRGKDGRPEPMFDRDTGDVDPNVVAYWRDHYDIAYRLQKHWHQLAPNLNGKIHVLIGTADTFYLDGAAHRLKAVLDGLHAKADIRFLPGRTHFDLYVQGKDRHALLKEIAWQMYERARPHSALKPPAKLEHLPPSETATAD